VGVRRAAPGVLTLRFQVEGDLARVHVPPPGPACIAHRLWEHTCCEAFVALEGATGYHEFNFAPSAAWAAHAFRGYRAGILLDDQTLAPGITVQHTADRLTLDALVPLARLSPRHVVGSLRLALAAVIEEAGGRLSYWALRHPPGKPDFHHDDAFALPLSPPGATC